MLSGGSGCCTCWSHVWTTSKDIRVGAYQGCNGRAWTPNRIFYVTLLCWLSINFKFRTWTLTVNTDHGRFISSLKSLKPVFPTPMTHMEEKLLTQWNLHSAVHLNSFTINRGGKHISVEFATMCSFWDRIYSAHRGRKDVREHYERISVLILVWSYLFAHPGIRNTTHATLDQLWKGLVVEIRRTPSQKDALLKVIWFWAKTDIENAVKEKSICSDLTLLVFLPDFTALQILMLNRRLLESMAKNELCVGSEGVINSSDAVSCRLLSTRQAPSKHEHEIFF